MSMYQDKDWLSQKYWVEGLSLDKLAEECGKSSQTVLNWMRRFGIRSRTSSESHKGERSYWYGRVGKENPLHGRKRPKWIGVKISLALKGKPKSEVHRRNLSVARMGTTPWNKGLTKESDSRIISQVVSEDGRKSRRGNAIKQWQTKSFRSRMSGVNNPSWMGGISFEPYGVEFNNVLKEQIRKRDSYTCQGCGTTKNRRGFPVHHIDYNKRNNEWWNLITLCDSCHMKTNFDRKSWQDYFENEIIIRKENNVSTLEV